MKIDWSMIKRSVGAKIALATAAALLFVTILFLALFSLLGIPLLSKLNLIQLIIIFFVLLVFVETTLVILATSIFVGRPLQQMRDAMRAAEEGNFLIRVSSNSSDELGELAQHFNLMLSRMTGLEAHKLDAERELIAAQEGLKYQAEIEKKAHALEVAHTQLENSLKDLSLLYSISQSFGRTLELAEFFQAVSRILTDILNLKEFSLLFYNEKREYLEVKASSGFSDAQKIHGMKFTPGEGISGLVAQEGRTIHIDDTSHDSRYLHYKGEKLEDGSFVSIPLVASGLVVGVLNVSHAKKGAFTLTDVRSLESVASQIAVAYERSKLFMQIKSLSVTDELTGLYNRRHFDQVLKMEWKRAVRFQHPLSLMMVDVDHFKKFNDTYGHLKGDEALRQIARVLGQNLREVDTVSRYGGEEFVILLPDTALEDAVSVAEKLRQKISEHHFAGLVGPKDRPQITVSIGVAAYPAINSSEEELIDSADQALYRAKNDGRNQVAVMQTSAQSTGEELTH